MNFKKLLTGLALVGLIGVAGLTSAYYPGDDGFEVPTYGAATLATSLTVATNTVLDGAQTKTPIINVGGATSACTLGSINIGGCLTNSSNPVVNISATAYTCPAGQNCHGYSDSRILTLDTGMAANSYDARGTVVGSVNIDHFANFQAGTNYNGTGIMTDLFGLYTTGTNLSTGTITNGYGVYVAGMSPGFGTLTNNYGLYVADLNGTNQYPLWLAGTDDVSRIEGSLGMGVAPVSGQKLVIRETSVLGTWLSGPWFAGATYPTVRLHATTADLWSGLGNNSDGSLHFLVGGSGTSGTPVDAGGIYVTGGLVLGAATSGDKGLGTINVATNIYKNNTAYTNPDYVFEHYFNNGKIVRFAKNDGAKEYRGLAPLSDVRIFVEKHNVLPRLFDAREKARKDPKAKGAIGLFDGGDAVLASIEEAYLYLFKHEARITQLEKENEALRRDLESLKKIVLKKVK